MEIKDLKERLDILEVAETLGIQIDPKTKKACCPFHADKNPSLQFSKEKQICTCFSSNCTAGTMDVIGLAEKKLGKSTHEAIKYLKEFAGQTSAVQKTKTMNTPNYAKDFEQMQSSFISSSTARDYAESRSLDRKLLTIGYNAFKGGKFSYLRGCITFGLKDEKGKVVSLYGRSVRNNNQARHYYTPDRKGLYPSYPPKDTRKLILTESIIDAATLLSIPELTTEYQILALYGTNGLTTEHVQSILKLDSLTEIILFLDGDFSGKSAVDKYGGYLKELIPGIKITTVDTPEGEDINSIAVGHEPQVFTELLNNRILLPSVEEKKTSKPAEQPKPSTPKLDTSNPNKITYRTQTANYYIKGGIRKDLDSLKVTLVIEHPETKQKSRNKLDLYEDKQTERVARESGEKLNLRADLIEADLSTLTDLLDDYREAESNQETDTNKQVIIPSAEKERCIKFLKNSNLLENINKLIGQSGVVGEETNRLFLFCIASSYKMPETLHALIQGSSGSGKTHLLAAIMDLMPEEDTISLTRVTESSFYNYDKYELSHKLIGLEDYDGLGEDAEMAFRELQSKGKLSSSTSGKDEQTGSSRAYVKDVDGPIASLSATTHGEVYEDNMSRCFLVAVDESHEQTMRIIKYQNRRAAGGINKQKKAEAKALLQNCIRLLKPYEVINPYADKIDLPQEAHKIRRLNELFQSYVRQITILHQYQRSRASTGELITEKADIKAAIEIMFDSILLKVDELDGSLRDFYERLKAYVGEKGEGYAFTRREVRHHIKTSNTQLHRYMKQLLDLEYIYQSGGYDNRGHKYKIHYWDDNQKLRAEIRSHLNGQLEKL